MRWRAARLIGTLGAIGALAGLGSLACGEEQKEFKDGRIVEALKLEHGGEGYTLGGDPFCVLSDRFFTGSGEVEAALSDEDTGVVVASREGNVAVEGVPPFAPDCKRQARKRLDKLDPPSE